MIDYSKESGIEAVWKKVNQLVNDHGWAVLSVGASPTCPTYTYTIGLTKRGYPDVFVMGLTPSVAQPILNAIAQRILDEEVQPIDGAMIQGAANMALHLKKLESNVASHFALGANRFCKENSFSFEILQVMLPDVNHKFPWDDGCDANMVKMQDAAAHALAERT